MTIRLEVFSKENRLPGGYQKLEQELNQYIDADLKIIKSTEIYQFSLSSDVQHPNLKSLLVDLYTDPVLHDYRFNQSLLETLSFDCYIETAYKNGVTDNKTRMAKENLAMGLNLPLKKIEACRCSRGFFIQSTLNSKEIKKAFYRYLINPTIENIRVTSKGDQKESYTALSPQKVELPLKIKTLFFENLSLEYLDQLSYARCLSLSREENTAIIRYFNDRTVIQERLKKGISPFPSDVELEALAQTWSEHCKHKIFNADIEYTDENGGIEYISSLFKIYIENPTQQIMKRHGKKSWCLSVFKDNAGIIRFNEKNSIAFKVETHNSPSAIDPYGGAMTGIVGVNRDSFGTGMGAELLANTNVLCFGSPDYKKPLPDRIFHPARVFHGVRKGIEEGGNLSGIPTVNGSIVFDPSYAGKPLVFCGTVSQMPSLHHQTPSENKKVKAGDLIVMTGGKVGKDGIHGATFSSEILTEHSPSSAVQIGDPITQKKMFDFLWEAKSRNLYTSITDNGAGGLSSSVGEMALDTNGCRIDLDKVPLKYSGLLPWEILVSESQERMTLSVSPQNIAAFLELSKEMEVESVVIGEFNNSSEFECRYDGEIVANLKMEFLHTGVPKMQLKAKWLPKNHSLDQSTFRSSISSGELLHKILSRPNVCSKETIIRQYDHEVKGGSVLKPLTGKNNDGPNNSAVIRPDLSNLEGVVIGNGICPKYSPFDTYHMVACAIDEAIRNIIVVGARPDYIAGLDNFCWPDPVESPTTPDGQYKLAQLVRACQGLKDYCLAYGVPCISGKDSMKNDLYLDQQKISILPTLLFSVIGKIDDIQTAVSSDFKTSGDLVYILGDTFNECGGSELYAVLGIEDGICPKVNAQSAFDRYKKLNKAISKKLIASAHDCSDGGLAVAIAESCIGGDLGVELSLDSIKNCSDLNLNTLLFSESQSRIIVSINPRYQAEFEKLMTGSPFYFLGTVTSTTQLQISTKNQIKVSERLKCLKHSWKKTLRNF